MTSLAPTDRNVSVDDARRSVRKLLTILASIQDVNPFMPLPEVAAFLYVAINEGKSLTEISQIAGAKQSSMSRYLLDLSEKVRGGGAGYSLVRRETDPNELRRNLYTLTPKGRALVNSIATEINS